MKAAVVSRYGESPRYESIDLPERLAEHEVVVEVVAAGLHPRVRSQAAGSHYTSTDALPLVPGVDGVVRMADGSLRYAVLGHGVLGSMAEQTVIDVRRSVALPPGTDPVQVAAAMNPAMSAWIQLRRRIDFRAGQSVLVLGATGSAGRLAVRVARALGAGRVTAVGRGAGRMADLGADVVVPLDGEAGTVAGALGAAGQDVDVVLDYLWGEPTRAALLAIVPRRVDDQQQLTWVQIGSVAGPECAVPSAALRATRLQIVGSGQGSVATRDIVAELGELARAVHDHTFDLPVRVVALRDVEQAWTATEADPERVVLVP